MKTVRIALSLAVLALAAACANVDQTITAPSWSELATASADTVAPRSGGTIGSEY